MQMLHCCSAVKFVQQLQYRADHSQKTQDDDRSARSVEPLPASSHYHRPEVIQLTEGGKKTTNGGDCSNTRLTTGDALLMYFLFLCLELQERSRSLKNEYSPRKRQCPNIWSDTYEEKRHLISRYNKVSVPDGWSNRSSVEKVDYVLESVLACESNSSRIGDVDSQTLTLSTC